MPDEAIASEGVSLIDSKKQEDEFIGVVSAVKQRFERAETARWADEQRWIKAYRNYRGEYGPDMQFRKDEKSRVFVKITKTKVIAAYGQLLEVLFGKNKFPISIEHTPVPEGISEYAHADVSTEQPMAETISQNFGFPGDGKNLPPGAISPVGELGGGLKEAGFVDGPAPETTNFIQIHPAAKAAKKLEKVIHDQIEASDGTTALRSTVFEQVLLGSGVLKGPFNIEKTVNFWSKNEDGKREYTPIYKTAPKISNTCLFSFYPDPEATTLEDAEYVIELHKMSKSQLRRLMKRPFFRKEAITECIAQGPNWTDKNYESYLQDATKDSGTSERFAVLEYWGTVDKDMAQAAGLKIEEDMDEMDEIEINAWICGNEILRLVANPFTPTRIPYNVVPYEVNPYSMFGIGVPEDMDDAQMVMNGHVRMAIDNLALSGNLVFDIDETALVAGQSMDVFPGKIFRRQGGISGQAIYGLKFPNTASENLEMFRVFRQFADEETGIPSFSHGQTGVQGTGRTASGISMLMGAAALSIKTVIRNVDNFLLRPLGENYFNWNMQFNEDDDLEFRGDLEIKARGTSALVQKEVRSQRLLMFFNVGANPAVAPLIRWTTLLEELAESLEIDPEKILNSPEEAKLMAKLIGIVNAQQGNGKQTQSSNGESSGMGGISSVPGGADPTNASGVGDGFIGTGVAPVPGESGFSANS